MSGRPAVFAVLALAVAVALFFVLRDDDSSEPSSSPAATTADADTGEHQGKPREREAASMPRIELRSGEPRGGIEQLEATSGERIAFEVSSDVADEVHVHGYDIEEELPAGKPVKLDFPATIEGVFEVESHHFETQIAELTVSP